VEDEEQDGKSIDSPRRMPTLRGPRALPPKRSSPAFTSASTVKTRIDARRPTFTSAPGCRRSVSAVAILATATHA